MIFCTIFSGYGNAKATEIPFSGEGIQFDSEGNLWMITHDKAAVTGIRYTTLGWTIKRYNAPIPGNQSVRVKLETYCPDKVDPDNPSYLYGYFMIHKDVIFQNIMKAHPDWANDLYTNGGIVYLDGIMTVSENGIKKGQMNESGDLYGEAYTTYEGIAGARNWRDKEGLKSHFNKSVYFPANPGMLEKDPEPEEGMEIVNVTSGIHEGNLQGVNSLRIYSDEFDVTRAIPSSENVNVAGSLQKYYYHGTYEHYYGTKNVPVTVNVSYTLVWNDGKAHKEYVTVSENTEVAREYSYWKIRNIALNYLKDIEIANGSFPEGRIWLNNCYYPQVTVQKNTDPMKLPEATVTVNGGIIQGGKKRPATPSVDAAALAEQNVGKIKVKNDTFIVDGEVWMDGSLCEEKTKEPVTLSGERKQPVGMNGIRIPAERKNQIYESMAEAYYAPYFNGGTGNHSVIPGVNEVSVHTPVVCVGLSSDDIKFNQQIVPTEKKSLILGREFAVSVSTAGTHLNEKGYGTRDYRKYAKDRQVKFPFHVVIKGQTIEAGTWLSLKSEQMVCTLPVDVTEGDYVVEYRTIAINEGGEGIGEKYANLNRENDMASGEVAVSVIGRVYDFQVTNVIDYPRWEKVFWKEGKTERTGCVYYSGTNDLNGTKKREKESLYLIPILKGSHPADPKIHAPGLGYRMEFSLKTIGSMAQEEDRIELIPTYYYRSPENENMQEVRLYNREDLTEFYLPVTLTAAERSIMKDGMQTWAGSYQIPPDVYVTDAGVDLAEYVKSRHNRITQKDPVFLKDGYLVVHFKIRTVKEGKLHLDYENSKNVHKGYCDMWKTEGFQTDRVDSDGLRFKLKEGDVFVFDRKKNMHRDYTSVGTH